MICPKCSNAGVENEVLGQRFWYCRTCKEEIFLEEPKTSLDEVDGEFLLNIPGIWGDLA